MMNSVNKKKSNKGRGRVYRNIHLGLGKQFQEATLILAEEDCDVPIDLSPLCGQEPPEKNFPEVVVLSGLGIISVMNAKEK